MPHDIEMIGAIRPELQSGLANHGGTGGTGAALFDGAAALDAARLEALLAQGRTVVLVEPSADSLDLLMTLSGTRIDASAAVALKRDADGHYHFSSAGATGGAIVGAAVTLSEHDDPVAGAGDGVSGATAAPLSVAIGALIDTLAAPAAPLLRGVGSLIGPPGSYSGEISFHQTISGTLGPVLDNFPRAKGRSQPFSSQCVSTFYVYYEEGADPRYTVILKQQLMFGAGAIMINDDCNRGCGMYKVTSDIRDVKVNAGELIMLSSSPESESAIAKVRQDLNLRQKADGGTAILPTIIEDGIQLSLTDWIAVNRTEHGLRSAGWEFVQSNLRNGLGNITETLFDGQTVRPYSVIARSSLSATTFAVWRISKNRRPILNLGLEIGQHFMIIANGGCRKGKDYRGGDLLQFGSGIMQQNLDLALIAKVPA